MVCVGCFRNEGLRQVATRFASSPATLCGRCGSNSPPLTPAELHEIAFEFFRNGSIPARSQFGTERYRISDHEHVSIAHFRSSLADDCELLQAEAKVFVYEYEPSPLWRIGCGDIQLALQAGGQQTQEVLNLLSSTAPEAILRKGTTLYRVRSGAVSPHLEEFDPPPPPRSSFGRFDSPVCEVLYTAKDIETCLHEVRVAIPDEISLATLRVETDLRVADLTAFPDNVRLHDSLNLLCRSFCLGGEHYYESCRNVAAALRSTGFAGFIYESYYSLVKPNAPKNLALFGRPLASGDVALISVNGVHLRQVDYGFQLGPAPFDAAG